VDVDPERERPGATGTRAGCGGCGVTDGGEVDRSVGVWHRQQRARQLAHGRVESRVAHVPGAVDVDRHRQHVEHLERRDRQHARPLRRAEAERVAGAVGRELIQLERETQDLVLRAARHDAALRRQRPAPRPDGRRRSG
jgi:hypothetical protein